MQKPINKTLSSILGGGLVILAINGCAGVTSTVLKQAPAKPIDCKFDIYASESEVPKKFETLCLVEAPYTGPPQLI